MDAFKELAWDNLVKKGLASLFARVPALGWGPIGWLVTYVVEMYSEELYLGLREFLSLEDIAFKKEGARKSFDKSAVVLQIMYDQKGPDSKEFKDARENGKTDLAKFLDMRAA